MGYRPLGAEIRRKLASARLPARRRQKGLRYVAEMRRGVCLCLFAALETGERVHKARERALQAP